MFLTTNCFAQTTITAESINIIDPINGKETFLRIKQNNTTYSIQYLIYKDGSIRQLRDFIGEAYTTETISKKKMAFITKSKLQLESLNNINDFKLYNRE